MWDDVASKISACNNNFDSYLPNISTTFAENSLTEEEFKKTFFLLLKHTKTTDYENININVIKKTYKELKTILMRIFNLSLSADIFPD